MLLLSLLAATEEEEIALVELNAKGFVIVALLILLLLFAGSDVVDDGTAEDVANGKAAVDVDVVFAVFELFAESASLEPNAEAKVLVAANGVFDVSAFSVFVFAT